MSKKNLSEERKGEDASERPIDMPKVPIESTHIQPGVISGEASTNLILVKESLLVEAGYGVLHTKVPHV